MKEMLLPRSAAPVRGMRRQHASSERLPISHWLSWKVVVLVALFVAAQTLTSYAGVVLILGMSIYALRSPFAAIQSLSLLPFVLLLNHGLVSNHSLMHSLRWILLIAAFVGVYRVRIKTKTVIPAVSKLLVLFIVVVAFLSIGWSRAADISLLKLVSFALLTFTAFSGFSLTSHRYGEWERWFFSLFVAIILWSAPFYFTSVGYWTNGSGFQGIFNQPQLFGIILAPFTAWGVAKVLDNPRRASRILYGVLAISFFFILSSRARTAGGGLIIGTAVVFLSMILGTDQKRRRLIHFLLRPISIVVFLLFCSTLPLLGPKIGASFNQFLQKNQTSVSDSGGVDVGERFEASRGSLVAQSMNNFRQHPYTGIGFGIGSDPYYSMMIPRTGPLGLPVSAPVEKGVVWSGALEEVGIFGFALLMLLIGAMLMGAWRAPGAAPLGMLATCLAVNTGEMILFSPGGIGNFFWILMGFCVFAHRQKLPREVLVH